MEDRGGGSRSLRRHLPEPRLHPVEDARVHGGRGPDRPRERFDLRLNSVVDRVSAAEPGVRLDLATPSGPQRLEAEVLLVATGRRPNSDLLDVAAARIEVDSHGHVRTDDACQTSVQGIWALGDLAN